MLNTDDFFGLLIVFCSGIWFFSIDNDNFADNLCSNLVTAAISLRYGTNGQRTINSEQRPCLWLRRGVNRLDLEKNEITIENSSSLLVHHHLPFPLWKMQLQ